MSDKWKLYETTQDVSILADDRIKGWSRLIAKVIYDDDEGARLRNAHLIAAAPMMYEALDAARVALELTKLGQARAWNHIYDAIKAALAEAGGRE